MLNQILILKMDQWARLLLFVCPETRNKEQKK